ncbi:MAG: bifunctional demethylmenaquinone methyltransferase/2-methoxy-6-polyprenyl-1,4-benzoquinol methylase UbiE [Planctomycetota bacterium]|nr:MAG: bifunctional demethylmenaquinone methyltransferase/2-methoxy-6-polyprenyl-1,4-benzoquinol methylase UbiE [Planctomycetota bacterium]
MKAQIRKIDSEKKRRDDVRRMFASIARRYDLLNHLLSLSLDVTWRRETVRLADLSPGATVLDVCAGTGDLALAFSARLGGRGKVIATDITSQMLEMGNRKLRAARSNGVAFAVADTLSLPVADETVDVVSAAFGVRNLESMEDGLSEIARVLRPGGRALILEFAPPRSPVMKRIYGLYLNHVIPIIGRVISGSRIDAYRYLAETISKFLEPAQLAGMMKSAGLREVTVHPLTCGIVNVHRGVK